MCNYSYSLTSLREHDFKEILCKTLEQESEG